MKTPKLPSRGFCKECGKVLVVKRDTKKYCSACKQRLYRKRKKVAKNADENTLTFDLFTDLGRLRHISPKAAASLERVMALAGQETFAHAIQGVWDAIIDLGYQFNDKTGAWECVKP